MPSRHPDGAEALVEPLYLLAFFLVATPAMDFVSSIVPLRPGDIQWRFASVGLLSGFLLTPLLGITIAMGVASFAEHLRFQRILAVVNLTLAVAFLVLMVFFLLDIFQLRAAVQEEAEAAFSSAATKAVLKHCSFIVMIGVLGWRGWRMSRWAIPETRRQQGAVMLGN